MPLLTKEAIFDIAEQGYRTEIIDVPQWGDVQVRVRELSEAEFRKVGGDFGGQQGAAAVNRAMDYVYDVAVWCVIDEDGENVFTNKDRAELRRRAKTATFYQGLARIANAVFDLSGLVGEETEEEEVEAEAEPEQEPPEKN